MYRFRWTKAAEEAAELVAENDLTQAEIGEKVGLARQQITRWVQNPQFMARVEEHRKEFRERVKSRGISIREKRINALDTRWRLMHQVIAERAASPEMQNVPGGKTGLIVRNIKGIGKGEDFRMVELYEVDTGLLKELREHEKQAAQDLGQWVEKAQTDVNATLIDRQQQQRAFMTPEGIELVLQLEKHILGISRESTETDESGDVLGNGQ